MVETITSKQQDNNGIKDPSRRLFLKATGVFIPTALFSPFDIFASWGYEWDFFNYRRPHRPLHWQEVTQKYVPLGPEKLLKPGTKKYEGIQKKATPLLIKEIKKRGFDMGGHYKVDVKSQIYGVPEDHLLKDPLLEYCHRAIDYFNNHPELSELEKISVDWHVIEPSDNFESNFNEKGFIGNSYYEVQRLEVINKNDKSQTFTLCTAIHSEGSLFYPDRDPKTGYLNEWYVFISSTNPIVLIVAPTSELSCLYIDKATIDYEKEVETDVATQAAETITEGISHVLTSEIAKKLDIRNGEYLLQEGLELLSKIEDYKYVPDAINFIHIHGLKNTIELYLESPRKYMEAIAPNYNK